jgi:hypothetical protein
MTSLKHYGDSKIIINGNEYSFSDFLKLEPQYTVPWRFSIRVYERGVQHYVSDGSNTMYLSKEDPYCDAICNREGELARLVALLQSEQN